MKRKCKWCGKEKRRKRFYKESFWCLKCLAWRKNAIHREMGKGIVLLAGNTGAGAGFLEDVFAKTDSMLRDGIEVEYARDVRLAVNELCKIYHIDRTNPNHWQISRMENWL